MSLAMRLVHRFVNSQPRVREQLTRMIYGSKDTDIELFLHQVRVNALLENGYYRAAGRARGSNTLRHESAILQRLALFIEDDMTFVDIGANIGLFSLSIAEVSNLYPKFKVVAFEANPDTAKRLRVNAERYGFEAFSCPLASAEREIEFVRGAVSGVTTIVDRATAYNVASRRFTAKTRRLDSFDLSGNLFLKIDVEGQELDVLHGASAFFEAARVKAVYVDGFDYNQEIPNFLAGHGMTLLDPVTLLPFTPADHTVLAIRR